MSTERIKDRFVYLKHRLFATLVCFIFLALSGSSVLAKDWLDNYLARPHDPADSLQIVQNYQTATRELIHLNGEWQARQQGDEDWRTVSVPGAYEFQGEIEFKRVFRLDSSWAGRAFKLAAFGMNNRSTIFVNGAFVGGHVGGHTSFTLDLDKKNLRIGDQNEIQIIINSSLLPRTSLPLKHAPRLLYNYGGIFRDIFIIAQPMVSVEDLVFKKEFSEGYTSCQMEVEATIRNRLGIISSDSLSLQFHVELWGPTAQMVHRSESHDVALDKSVLPKSVSILLQDLKLWHPDVPILYELRGYLSDGSQVFDETKMKIGFNEFGMSNRGPQLNGQRFQLKGVDIFEEYPGLGPAAGLAAIRARVSKIKEIGANAIRVIGTPPHPFFLDVCDELGLLVFEEMPLISVPEQRFKERAFVELAIDYFVDVLRQDAHHAALAAWGLGSDFLATSNSTSEFLDKLKENATARSDRPIYVVLRHEQEGAVAESVDFTIVEGYGKEPHQVLSRLDRYQAGVSSAPAIISYGYPFLVKGSGSLLANGITTSDGRQKSSQLTALDIMHQEVQASKLRQMLPQSGQEAKAGATFVHTFSDWREARPNLFFGSTGTPFLNKSGLVDVNGEKRFAYEVVTAALRDNQRTQIPIHELEEQNPIAFPVIGLAIILFFFFNFHRSRSLRGNMRRIFVYPHGFWTEVKDKRKISPWHTFLLSMIACTGFAIMLASLFFDFRKELLFNEFLSLLIGSSAVKFQLVRLVWHPAIAVVFLTIVFYLLFGLLIFFLKSASVAFDARLPIGQFYTLVFWASASFIWLFPIVPIFYRVISQPSWILPAILVVFTFFGWFCIRLLRALRVVFGYALPRLILTSLVLFGVLSSVLGWYYSSNYALFDYLPLYWSFVS